MLDTLRNWLSTHEGRVIFLGVLAIALAAGGIVGVYVGRETNRMKKNVAILAMALVLWIVLGSLVGLLS